MNDNVRWDRDVLTVEAQSEAEARELAPWAAYFAEVEGGWICFRYYHDYETHMKQV